MPGAHTLPLTHTPSETKHTKTHACCTQPPQVGWRRPKGAEEKRTDEQGVTPSLLQENCNLNVILKGNVDLLKKALVLKPGHLNTLKVCDLNIVRRVISLGALIHGDVNLHFICSRPHITFWVFLSKVEVEEEEPTEYRIPSETRVWPMTASGR